MRPPWIEAAALLAAAGYRAIPNPQPVLEPVMPHGTKFALIKTPRQPARIFPSIDKLARRIHAERRGGGLELDPKLACIYPPGEPKGLLCVRVYRLGLDGNREADIGYAYVDGAEASREALHAALERQCPPAFAEPEAA